MTKMEQFQQYYTQANTLLAGPIDLLKSKLSLNTNAFPAFLQSPANFGLFLLISLFLVVRYANRFMCDFFGVLYPLMYTINVINTQPVNLERVVLMAQYWVMFGAITLTDNMFGFILEYVPLYYYLRFVLTYLLVRNEFTWTDEFYAVFSNYYTTVLRQYMNQIVGLIMSYTGVPIVLPGNPEPKQE